MTTFTAPAIEFGQFFPELVAGPDGNLWFTSYSLGLIGRITPDGDVTRFDGEG